MLKLTPILLILLYAAAMWFFSAWRLKAELNAKSTPLRHPRLVPMLDRLGRAMDLPRVQAHVYEVGHVNGLAAPDGRIFLTRGFLDRLDRGEVTEAELASVIAHELGHVAHGHTRRRMVDFAGQNVVRMVLAGVLGRFLPGIGVWIANIAASAIAARLSRQDEFEADAFASALMVKAGLGTGPQKSLFRKLDRLAGAGRAGAPAWLMSHPPADARIAAIEKLEARWELV
ncbi:MULTISPECIES: M48 family metallopeptidase [Paracoccus]|jgi:putative metalloprotease|uniref:Peptidase M48, Ste24p n=1 Tax=Paracoccus denitrificans (strain Pd 1222) TaxID=318586 RepID=A1B959_PARDP|nr:MULTISPECIES: M48 family metallopeptidase [Paracoccus]ABL72053.1 peptidase M48, Ste24p [Paracoccus denitrificans PD1222]MBB4626040.1 putative metalloprotease [Paracoccus denitrificans]MCU7426800.1 M48 family metallopeptidase [Paracoccus denitrificans]MDK8871977.1 M48 family metallopeptidase [Paracoccus sp. SSJ]QAR28630.1 peptidase M48 [Paracoccus denitrificans]